MHFEWRTKAHLRVSREKLLYQLRLRERVRVFLDAVPNVEQKNAAGLQDTPRLAERGTPVRHA